MEWANSLVEHLEERFADIYSNPVLKAAMTALALSTGFHWPVLSSPLKKWGQDELEVLLDHHSDHFNEESKAAVRQQCRQFKLMLLDPKHSGEAICHH